MGLFISVLISQPETSTQPLPYPLPNTKFNRTNIQTNKHNAHTFNNNFKLARCTVSWCISGSCCDNEDRAHLCIGEIQWHRGGKCESCVTGIVDDTSSGRIKQTVVSLADTQSLNLRHWALNGRGSLICWKTKLRLWHPAYVYSVSVLPNSISYTHTHTHTQKNKALWDSWALHRAGRTEYGVM